tara:strand:+ start:207 stop:458 length:252 start_codon:yes stop_codon:yes gene_type:complete
VVEVVLYIMLMELTVVLVEVVELIYPIMAVAEIPLAQRHLKVMLAAAAEVLVITVLLTLEEEEEAMDQLGQPEEMFLVMVVLV